MRSQATIFRRLITAPGLLTSALLALLLTSAALGQEMVAGRCVGVLDGDTIKVLVAGNQLLRVRLNWIDAPEKSQAFGQRSKQHLSELVFGRQVELHTNGLDRYGRTLAVVMLDGVDINLEQVRSGFAWVLRQVISTEYLLDDAVWDLDRSPGSLWKQIKNADAQTNAHGRPPDDRKNGGTQSAADSSICCSFCQKS